MKKWIFVSLLLVFMYSLLLSSVILTSDNPTVVSKNGNLTLKLQVIQGFNGTQSAILKVRPLGNVSFQSYDMQKGNETNPIYYYQINDLTQFGRGFDYYFEVIAIDGSKFTLPEYQPAVNPYHITIEEKLDYDPKIIKLSPDSKYISKDDFVIAISYYAIKNKIDKNTIQLILDGENIVKKAKISSDMIVAKISNPNKGTHRFYMKAKLVNGKEVKSKIWETTIETKQFTLPFELNSFLQLNHSGYARNTDEKSVNKSQTNFRFRTTLEKDWFGFKSNIFLSSYQKPNRQNINKIMFDFYVPSLDIILGDYSPNMGDLVMNGKNIRGITGDFHFKNFKLKIATGVLNKKINGDEKTDENGETYYTPGTFKMRNLSAMMRVGSDNGFSWGISFAKNKDDISSLDKKYYAVLDSVIIDSTGATDTLYTYMTTPQDNFVVGTNVRLTMFQRRIDLGADVAMSVYNPNIIDGALSKKDITNQYANVNLPIDPKDFESIYVYNLNSQPLKPGKANMAYKLHFTSLFYKNYFNVSYSSIGEVYNSLSVCSLSKNKQALSIFDNFNLIKYFNMNFGFNLVNDNVDKSSDITNYVTSWSAGASYNSPDYPSLSVRLSNITSEDKNSYKIGTGSFMMSTGYQFGNIPKFPSKVSFSFSNFDNKDIKYKFFTNNRKTIEVKTETYFEDLPLVTSLVFNYGINDYKVSEDSNCIAQPKTNYTVFGIKNRVNLLEDRLKPYLSFSHKNISADNIAQTNTIFQIGTSYNFYENTNLYTDFGYINKKDKNDSTNNSNSFNWNFTISYKF